MHENRKLKRKGGVFDVLAMGSIFYSNAKQVFS